jgi:transcriptional regulator with XRE-family HTH domain
VNILIQIEQQTGLKPKDMANKLGITKSYYSMMKNNVRPISKEVAIKIHEIFKIPLENIFFTHRVNGALTNGSHPPGGDAA